MSKHIAVFDSDLDGLLIEQVLELMPDVCCEVHTLCGAVVPVQKIAGRGQPLISCGACVATLLVRNRELGGSPHDNN